MEEDKYRRRRVGSKEEGCKDGGMENGERSKRGGGIDTCCFKLQALTRMLCAGGAQCSNHIAHTSISSLLQETQDAILTDSTHLEEREESTRDKMAELIVVCHLCLSYTGKFVN